MSGNGKSYNLPRSVNIPADDIPNQNQMIEDIWVDMKMLKIKMYGDKEKDIIGVTDELKSMKEDLKTIKLSIEPILDERKLRKLLLKIVITVFTVLGLGSWLKDYIPHLFQNIWTK